MVLIELFDIYQTTVYILELLIGFPIINPPYLVEISLYQYSF